MFTVTSIRFKGNLFTCYCTNKNMYFIYITITNENWLEEKVNNVQCQKLDFLALSSLSSTSTGLSPKSFEKRAHNKNCVGHKIFYCFWV